jgi:hypothetical protein
LKEDRFEVAYRLLDTELIDAEGRRCGRVDDLEIEGEPGGAAQLTAILSGPGVWEGRMPRPLRRVAARVFGDDYVRVPLEGGRGHRRGDPPEGPLPGPGAGPR